MTEQDLQAIRLLMREELAPVNKRLERLEEGLSELREGQEELRSCVNSLLEWADKVSDTSRFPMPRV